MKSSRSSLILFVLTLVGWGLVRAAPVPYERMVELTFQSKKSYVDPFNDVDVDVLFSNGKQSWRVPAFWRGDNRWTARFAPSTAGEYRYRLESTDLGNSDLNGHTGRVTITSYRGSNVLLKHGPFRISTNKRYFEHADGTPFFWLGDTWWSGLSDRIDWEGFQKLVLDRRKKGFTVAQMAMMAPSNEEVAPIDPGFHNEGGAIWDPEYKRINPKYFDYADRRIQYLIDQGIAPALVGAWQQVIGQMGVARMKKHWRYIIARYGAYPVFWIAGGEILDPPEELVRRFKGKDTLFDVIHAPGWTEVVRYIRTTDPYHHPVSVHDIPPPLDTSLQDESLKDFDFFQCGHGNWPSIAVEITRLNRRYGTKPLVIGELGYEQLGGTNLEDFQRVAFWMAYLNGAAGYSYGADGLFEFNSPDKPLHRIQFSFRTWEEGMNFPGSRQIGLSSRLLQSYPWERMQPHPEWVTPRGTRAQDLESPSVAKDVSRIRNDPMPGDEDWPAEWATGRGNFRRPYAAGVPGQLRLIYMPYFGFMANVSPDTPPPTVLGLEANVRYQAYFWDPSSGIKVDLGAIERPPVGKLIFEDVLNLKTPTSWTHSLSKERLTLAPTQDLGDVVISVDALSAAQAEIVLRYVDDQNYLIARYSQSDRAIYLLDQGGNDSALILGKTAAPILGENLRLTAEANQNYAIVSVTDGQKTYTSPIVNVASIKPGRVGLLRDNDIQRYSRFEVRESQKIAADASLQTQLFNASGEYRGELKGPSIEVKGYGTAGGWDFPKQKILLLDAYRPQRLPTSHDWLLVLENRTVQRNSLKQ